MMHDKRSYTPINEWFRTKKDWQDFFSAILLKEDELTSKYLEQNRIRKMMEEQKSGIRDHSLNLLQIATFKLFIQEYFGDDDSPI